MEEIYPAMSIDHNKKFLNNLLNSTVLIAGNYTITTDGKESNELAYSFSACVVTLNEHWLVLTAGHAIQDHISRSKHGSVRITSRVLFDGLGANAISSTPLPFDPVDRATIVRYEEKGIDYAILPLAEHERKCLESNGIKPFPLIQGAFEKDFFSYEGYWVVGFPEEETESEPSANSSGVGVQPIGIPLKPIEYCDAESGRSVFQIIDMGRTKSMVGLSGGPVFAYKRENEQAIVYLIGIQSAWHKLHKFAYTCSLESIVKDIALSKSP